MRGYMLPPEGYMIQTPGQITSTCFVALLVYVDDILLSGNSKTEIAAIKSHLDTLFTIKDLGHAKYFLGLELALSLMMMAHYCFDPGPFRRLVGRLLYLGFTRPDISFATQQLRPNFYSIQVFSLGCRSTCSSLPQGTSSLGLFFSAQNSLQPTVYTDASWTSCPESRRSITGFLYLPRVFSVSWKTKKQSPRLPLLCRSRISGMGAAVCELLWLSYHLHALHIPFSTPVPFWCDNQAAIHITATPFS
ncbi:UNVERIFIED_CONTAM: Retrovirus-related Pol polyprotein from transposon RE1 [Sesamum angustifolium]|uniref:Retrovirus-related Pol polyprotein from transposon RE1 n=1 Tax=Sesamum angustifolium TaxID=2727405 RepID=A0AAW2PC18_9LAMI